MIEMYAPPLNPANLQVSLNQATDMLIDDPEFFVALTHQQLELTGVHLPLVVAKVTRANWKTEK